MDWFTTSVSSYMLTMYNIDISSFDGSREDDVVELYIGVFLPFPKCSIQTEMGEGHTLTVSGFVFIVELYHDVEDNFVVPFELDGTR